MPKVRLIGADGGQVGIVETDEARRIAREADLDLVEVAPESRPPVCKVLDYSKYKYEQEQKAKQARKHQQQVNVREIKLRPKIADHDYETKKGHVARFLNKKDKVKVTIMFRGREQAHPERGRALLDRLTEDLSELAVVEQAPQREGRNMHMVLGPSKEAGKEPAKSNGKPAAEPAAPAAEAKPAEAPPEEATPEAAAPEASAPEEAAPEAAAAEEAAPEAEAPATEAAPDDTTSDAA